MAKKTLGNFLCSNFGWTFNFVVIHILFWAQGLPTFIKYGYNNESYNSKGGIESGGNGSGVFIVTLVLFLSTTLIYLNQIKNYFTGSEKSD